MNGDGIHRIKLWVLDHACKHGMDSVMKFIVKDTAVEELFEVIEHDSEELTNSAFLFLLLIRNLINSLKTDRRDAENKYATWNKPLLSLVTKLLMSTYTQNNYISVKQFLNLITRLKRMEVTLCLLEEPSVIVQQLNIAFPQMTESYKIELQECFGSSEADKQVLDRLQSGHTAFRRLILQLANNSKLRNNYISECLPKDMDKYTSYVLTNLKKVLKILSQKAGPSIIEKILMESSEQQHCSADPAIQLVLEYLDPEINEDNLINLLRSFDSDVKCIVDSGLMDTLSEMESEPDLGSDNREEEENEEDNVSTVKKRETLGEDTQFHPLAGASGCFVPADDEIEIVSDSEDTNSC